MNKQPINKEVTEEDLALIFKSLDELNLELSKVASEIFKNETDKKVLYKASHYCFSIVHRAIELNRAYKTLTNVNNYITAITLIRLQADNCMRLFALSLVENRRDFYEEVMKGTHIRNLKDGDGKKMTDAYLADKLDKIFPEFKNLYQNTSGFIHFSNEHIFLNNTRTETEDTFRMTTLISKTAELSMEKKVDYSFNMFYVGKNLYKLLKGYKSSMAEFLKD
ncbi:MAG: hypothetical protein JJE55_11140 [Flavobacteriaceae bacterium]|nr:hypothetical protein [Flavobacteriaceae bacterium]